MLSDVERGCMYTDLNALKSYLGISTSSDDALLTDCIENAQQMIETRTQRVFEASTDTTKKFDAISDVDDASLLLNADLCQITSVVNGDGSVIPSSNYLTDPPRHTPFWAIRLKRSSSPWVYTTDPEDAIQVTGRWAYSVTAPADIVQATLRLAAFLYRQKDTAVDGDRPILTGDGNVLMPSRLPNDVAEILRPYIKGRM